MAARPRGTKHARDSGTPGPPAAQARDAAAPGPVATQAQAETFTLDITLSGLCLLARDTAANSLTVLLPHAPAHGDMPEHLAVLGTHERYAPEGPFEQIGRFFEARLGEGTLLIEAVASDPIKIGFDKTGIADLSEVAHERAPLPDKARVRMPIGYGSHVEDGLPASGATWYFDRKKQRMATRLTWRIEQVRNELAGDPGVCIRFVSPGAHGSSEAFIIRAREEDGPGNGKRAAFYLYNSPAEELPSHPGHPQTPQVEPDVNHHFGAYYDLFMPRLSVPLPERVPDDDEDDEEEAEDDEGQAQPGAPAQALAASAGQASAKRFKPMQHIAERLSRSRMTRGSVKLFGGYLGFHGRLYTCTVAVADHAGAAAATLGQGAYGTQPHTQGQGQSFPAGAGGSNGQGGNP